LYLAAGAYAGSLLFSLLNTERTTRALLWCGFLAHTACLLIRGWHFGIFVPSSIFTELYFLPWCLAAATLWRKKFSDGRLTTLIPLSVLMVIAVILPVTTPPPSPKSSTVFATLFFLFEVISHALFLLGGWSAFLFLRFRVDEQSFNRCAVWGFILYSIAQVVGAVWSWLALSEPFHWSERHLVSASIWCFYCAYLHLHFSHRWSLKEKAGFVLIGSFLVVVCTYAYYLQYLGGARA
jgi:ABC-type transport system involved in cytochrome c biogenesis permease subunit